jgi:choline dehydrogenase-like flavoprotein
MAAVSNDNRVVVIGSGPPGATAALFLARAGIPVLVLEAGLEREANGLTFRVRGVTLAKRKGVLREREGVERTGDPDAQLFEQIAPGGLSNHWSCAVPRFSAEDFADARRAGIEQTWPLDYQDLAGWYERVEPLLHVSGPAESCTQLPAPKLLHRRQLADDWQQVAELAREQGRGVVAMPYAYGSDTTCTFSGTPFNSYVRLLRSEVAANRVAIRFGTRVLGLEWSPSRRRVEAVTFHDRSSGTTERVTCRAVVVAGGALNTPQILLASKSADFPDGLGNQHGLVGRYLHDHPLGKLVVELTRPMSVHPAAYVTRLELARAPEPLYAAACMQWCSASDLAKSVVRGHPKRLRTLGFSVFGTMVPSRNDYVALNEGYRGSDGATGLELHINHPPPTQVVLEQARDQLVQALEGAGWGPRIKVWKLEKPGNSNHYAGSCRMHESPQFGVVDGWSRLHGVPNVAVTDSSVFTTNPEKNPVLTSMTLAARAGDRLARELKAGDL